MIVKSPPSTAAVRTHQRELIDACGEAAVVAIQDGLIGAIAEVTSVRPDLAMESETNRARRNFLIHERAFCARFIEALDIEMRRELDAFLDSGGLRQASSLVPRRRALSLEGEEAIEQRTRCERIAAWVRNSSDTTFDQLRGRLARVMAQRTLRDSDVPIGGAICVGAAVAALGKVELDPRMVNSVLAMLEGPLVRLGVAAVRAADRALATRGIDPFDNYASEGDEDETPREPVDRRRAPAVVLTDTRIVRSRPHSLFDASEMVAPMAAHYESPAAVTSSATATALGRRVPLDSASPRIQAGALLLSTDAQRALLALLARQGPHDAAQDTAYRGVTVEDNQGPVDAANLATPGQPEGEADRTTSGSVSAAAVRAAVQAETTATMLDPNGTPSGDLTAIVVRDLLRHTPGGNSRLGSALLDRIDDSLRLAAASLKDLKGIKGIKGVNAVTAGREVTDAGSVADGQRLSMHADSRAEKLTIELIALLFDRIKRDAYVRGEIKSLLMQLHMPMLRLALMDPDRLVDPHAAPRRLLDRIAATAVGWAPDGDDNLHYLEEVRSAVLIVLQDPATGVVSFETALAQFEAFVNALYTRDDDAVARARRALEDAERQEIQIIRATIKVRTAFDGVPIESYLREFLLDSWVRVLVAAAQRGRERPGLLQRMVDLVPDLVWTVQPKLTTTDRKRMLEALPDLLVCLREGLAMCDWPHGHLDGFMQQLMQSHAMAVKAVMLAHGGVRPGYERSALQGRLKSLALETVQDAAGEEQLSVPDDVMARALAQRDAPVDHMGVPKANHAPALMPMETAARIVAAMSRGAWFELALEGSKVRVRLSWISPRRSLFLFSQPGGKAARSFTVEALVHFVAAGRMSPCEPFPLFERAMRSVLQKLATATAA